MTTMMLELRQLQLLSLVSLVGLDLYIWSLKDKSIPYNIKWRKVKQARSYSNISKRCNLCLWEKYFIIYKPDMSTLNNRSELISNCRHSKKFLLKNVLA